MRGAARVRHRYDGFTPEKRRAFFEMLAQTGCMLDGCRAAQISRNTVRRWRDKDEGFDAEFRHCLKLAARKLERLAWDRATVGAEEKVIRDGKVVRIKVKPSDTILRLLLQGAAPGKYGRTANAGQIGSAERRRIEAALREKIEREVRAEIEEEQAITAEEADELRERIAGKIERLRQRFERELAEQGYTPGPDGILVPPGWKMVRDPQAPAGGAPEAGSAP